MIKPVRTVRLVLDSNDLNELVRNQYGGHYDVTVAEGITDSSNLCLEFTHVCCYNDELEFFADEVTEFRLSGNPSQLTTFHILCILCDDNAIPPGDYLIRMG